MPPPISLEVVKPRAVKPTRARGAVGAIGAAITAVMLAPALIVSVVVNGAQRQSAGSCAVPTDEPARAPASRLYAQPLTVMPGRSYRVGATAYGGPDDSTSASSGSIPIAAQS